MSSPITPKFAAEPLAVIGMSCRLPGNSNSPTALWQFLERGGIARNEAPASRFRLKGHEDGSKRPKTMRSPGGMFLEHIDPADIDAQFFGLSKAEAIAMDPQQRQLLEVVYEGLENAGITLESLKGQPVGCFVGSYASDYGDIQSRDPEDRAPNTSIGIGRAMLSNRLSHFLDIKGPSMTIDTACSGSLVSLDVASRYLQTREISTAIIAGCNLYLSPEHCIDLSGSNGLASPSGLCHTFDAKADGYIKSEAVNTVIVKRLEDAIRDCDPIRAVIRGSATNSDGWTAGIASPSPEAQAAVTRQAYANAGIADFNSTTYLECHGTGTRAGDPIEVKGVASVFCSNRPPDQPLLIGSIKSNIGHSEPAAGISGLLKAILALENKIIPGNPTFETPNPEIDFHALRVRASKFAIPWPKVPVRRASVNSFGFGGSNAHAILDDASTAIPQSQSYFTSSYLQEDADFFADDKQESPHILVFSANDESSLKAYCKSITTHLINPRVSISLHDLAYTLSERRTRHFYRSYIITSSTKIDHDEFIFGKPRSNPPKIGFVFTGQGAQWSQMGKTFVDTFPSCKALLQCLDKVLQTLPDPPKWTLLDELTCQRTPEHLRQPEFSQPLVTALQLIVLSILETWGVHPCSVVGHSSGEIAAAAAAGYLTSEEAIQVAYYRGKAALDLYDSSKAEMGMLAVGLGVDSIVQEYVQTYSSSIAIACVNSPNSVTLSGYLSKLEEVKTALQAQGHFARLLQVDLAYHSTFMTNTASHYKKLLLDNCEFTLSGKKSVKMFSSTTGFQIAQTCDPDYWEMNMKSPVLFSQAVQAMMTDHESADFLIEIGPSNALASPVKQIKEALNSQGSSINYHPACKRGENAVNALFDVAGQIFLSDGTIDLKKVNQDLRSLEQPSVVVDLPNYVWNHSTKYWYESESSKDWRFRSYPSHDLLGSKILGTSWRAPSWKKVMRTHELTWLQDHKIGGQILFPAAGYVAMAIEALYQSSQSRGFIGQAARVYEVCYRLRNVVFSRAMVLEEGVDQRVMLTLTPENDTEKAWNKFSISSLSEEEWTEHCHGSIALQDMSIELAPSNAAEPFKYAAPAQTWYKAMRDVGYKFGPLFQPQIKIEAVAGSRHSRALLSFTEPPSAFPQSPYTIHPVAIDGCLQSGAPSLWQGIRSAVDEVLIPAIIDDLVVNSHSANLETGIAIASAAFSGVGSPDDAKSYKSHITVYDSVTKKLLVQVHGLRYHKLDAYENSDATHTYMHLEWKPDITYLSQEQLSRFATDGQIYDPSQEENLLKEVGAMVNLIAHKTPNLKVVEVNMVGDTESVWLSIVDKNALIKGACGQYCLVVKDATALFAFQERLSPHANIELMILDIARPSVDLSAVEKDVNLVIVRAGASSEAVLSHTIANSKALLGEGGYLLFVASGPLTAEMSSSSDSGSNSESDLINIGYEHSELPNLLRAEGFERILSIPQKDQSPDFFVSAYLSQVSIKAANESPTGDRVNLVHLSDNTSSSAGIKEALAEYGLQIIDHCLPLDTLEPKSIVLIAEDLYSPVLVQVNQAQWEAIQKIAILECKILWVTLGSQLQVTHPHNALIHGLARVIRQEDPTLHFITLDIESTSSEQSHRAIERILRSLQTSLPKNYIESGYVERAGIINISRVHPDTIVNLFEKDLTYGSKPQSQNLHDHPSCVRMICERPGRLESLCFTEVFTEEIPLPDDVVEVDMHAAGLNYKDVATCLGIVPDNQYLLGLEGAGIIRRVGKRPGLLYVGQRVLVYGRGSFGNKVQCPVEGIHALPDWMSFEEASTLPVVTLAVIYGLFDLANIQRGQSVLIHSAAGGLGIAAIQICQYIGVEIYATAGNEEKQAFLTETFSLSPDHIFSSRDTRFASRIFEMTKGKGVDVILNSLTGDLLDESWRIIADCGTMVELGKKDILDRNRLSMEPFSRNASYRAIDMSHNSITRPTVARLMRQMFQLITSGHIKAIAPRTVFAYNDIAGAVRYMRGGAHIGKIIISRSASPDLTIVPIRSAPRKLVLRGDISYLLVGGLKGLCGSLAVYLARHGAKYLVVMSRSGYDDEKSQGVLRDLHNLGAQCDLTKGDVSELQDVKRMFRHSTKPIGGIVQGAMVLRDKTFTSMTVAQFHDAVRCKVQGTWNLHTAAMEQNLSLDFFTMLSSISGLVGQKGQANYAAANTFLDSLAVYRQGLGLPACSVDLGVIEDVGYISERQAIADRLDINVWTAINESLLHKIMRASIFQQHASPIQAASAAHMIIGIPFPQQVDSALLRDARFAALAQSSTGTCNVDAGDTSRDVRALFALMRAGVDKAALLAGMVEIVNRHLMQRLGLAEPMEPAKQLAVYGLDSLAAVDFRNWVRLELGVGITTLEVAGAKTLSALCEKILEKIDEARQR